MTIHQTDIESVNLKRRFPMSVTFGILLLSLSGLSCSKQDREISAETRALETQVEYLESKLSDVSTQLKAINAQIETNKEHASNSGPRSGGFDSQGGTDAENQDLKDFIVRLESFGVSTSTFEILFTESRNEGANLFTATTQLAEDAPTKVVKAITITSRIQTGGTRGYRNHIALTTGATDIPLARKLQSAELYHPHVRDYPEQERALALVPVDVFERVEQGVSVDLQVGNGAPNQPMLDVRLRRMTRIEDGIFSLPIIAGHVTDDEDKTPELRLPVIHQGKLESQVRCRPDQPEFLGTIHAPPGETPGLWMFFITLQSP